MTGLIIQRAPRYQWLSDAEFGEVAAILQSLNKTDELRRITFNEITEETAKLFHDGLDAAEAPLKSRLQDLEYANDRRDKLVGYVIAGDLDDDLDPEDRDHLVTLALIEPNIFAKGKAA